MNLTNEIESHGNSPEDAISRLKADRDRLLVALASVQAINEELGMSLITLRNLLKEAHADTD
jgi:hypothetical protein